MTIETVSPLPDRRRWTALAVIALIQFILVLDITVVNNALPHIQSSLHFSRAGLAWVVDGYVLTAGGLLLLGGRLADLLGRKRMFLIGVTLFAVASVLSGAATSSGMMVASRLLQGTGEALSSPAAFGLVALLFTGAKERAKAIGIMGGVAGLGDARTGAVRAVHLGRHVALDLLRQRPGRRLLGHRCEPPGGGEPGRSA